MKSATEILRAKARDYEVKAAAATEQDELRCEQGELASPEGMLWATIACALYEVAEALEVEMREAA